jgi:hypothetical protein
VCEPEVRPRADRLARIVKGSWTVSVGLFPVSAGVYFMPNDKYPSHRSRRSYLLVLKGAVEQDFLHLDFFFNIDF